MINKVNVKNSKTNIQDNLQQIRKSYGMSQDDLAKRMGLSRPTVVKIENGERLLSVTEEKKLAEIFDLPTIEVSDIDIPKRNIEKFKQVFLYLIEKVGSKPNVGMTVLYKLLYFIDFDYYEKYEQQLMGLTYFKNTYGPAPREFLKVVDEMKTNEQVAEFKSKHFMHEQTKYLPIVKSDLSLLSAQELEMIENVISRYANKTAKELSELSHIDTPWACAEMGKDLKYEHVFYRPEQFSVKEYSDL